MSFDVTFQEAVQRHRTGDAAAAEALYRRVLDGDVAHDRACFLLGSLLVEGGRAAEGTVWMQRAVQLAASEANYHAALGETYRRSNEPAQALGSFERAALLEPKNAQLQLIFGLALCDCGEVEQAIGYLQCALLSNGSLEARERLSTIWAARAEKLGHDNHVERAQRSATALQTDSARRASHSRPSPSVERAFRLAQDQHQAGRIKDAEVHYRKALRIEPKHVETLYWYGSLALETGRVSFALDMLARACALGPGVAAYHSNFGEACVRAGKAEQGIAAFQRALALEPKRAERHFNLAIAFRHVQNRAAALESLEQASQMSPGNPLFQLELARELQEGARPRRAVGHFHASLASQPDAAVLVELAGLLRQQGFLDAALNRCRESLLMDRTRANAHRLLGQTLSDMQRLDEAIKSFEQALFLDPALPQAHADLALALLGNGRVEEAVASWERAMAQDPADVVSASNRLFALAFHDAFSDRAIAEEARRWAAKYEAPLAARVREHAPDGSPDKRLRIGYVGSVFREHPLGFVVLPLVTHHSREHFELYFYSSVTQPDALTERMQGSADMWRDVTELSDLELADLIRADQIDVLFDLNMHMATSRLLTFACRPAPVQVSGWSYPGTTGLANMDYRVTDRHLDPPGELLPYSEASIALPDTYWCYDPFTDQPTVPALSRSQICFGNLNGAWKVNQRSAELWAKVLLAVDGSTLVLLSPGWRNAPGRSVGEAQRRIASFFETKGVAPERVRFLPRTSRLEYLRYYRDIDLGLDSLPYAGHTTSLDALWMGVPTVSLLGQTIVGRSALTLANNLDLSEFLARTETEFVERVVAVASDLPALSQLRQHLRARLEASPLMDGRRFARNMEAGYRAAWQRHCAGQKPERIDVTAS